MARKSKSREAKPTMKMPMDPKMLGGIVLVVIIVIAAVLLTRGKGEEGTPPAYTPPEVSTTPPAQPETSPSATPECTKNADCNDADECTTDSCDNGVCSNIGRPDCMVKTEEKPTITAVNFAAREDEFVQIEGKNWGIFGWKITNGRGDTYLSFVGPDFENYDLNGRITVYTGCGMSTSSVKYICWETDFFSNTGDKAILKDELGNIVDQKLG